MSDIRFNRWLHQSGTGGVYQASSGNVGIGTSVPSTTLDVNGSISATSITAITGTITGNLSVGGVLTYEDVTNIDSIGIITARAGVKIPDSQKIFLGTADDLQIYHDGSESYVAEEGEGGLTISSGLISFKNQSRSETHATMTVNSGVSLFHNNLEKFKTTSGGIRVLGDTTLEGHLDMRDSDKIRLGAGDDLQIYHNGTDSYISDTATGSLILTGSRVIVKNAADNARMIDAIEGGAVKLLHNNSEKLETTTTGVSISGQIDIGTTTIYGTGDISMGDSDQLRLGGGDDLRIYHDGSKSLITDSGTGWLEINTNNLRLQNAAANETIIYATENGSVDLYYDNTRRFETVSNGTKTTGRIFLNGTNGGFDYNNIAHTLEFLVSNGSTHSELTHNAYVPSASGTRHLGYANKRWDTLYVDKIAFGGSANTSQLSLDDYEEGTSTTSIQNITADTNQVLMKYTKIGSVVCVVGVITIVNKTVSSSSNGWFHLPFAPSAHNTSVPGCSIQKNSINTNVAYLGFYGQNTNCYFMSRAGGYQNGNSLNNGQIGFTATYTTH